jgi:3-dehydroquinate dehydratase
VLSRQVNLIKSSRAISHVRCTLYTDVLMSISVIIIRVPEMDIETSVYNVHLTRLIAREDFIKLSLLSSVFLAVASLCLKDYVCDKLSGFLDLGFE